MNLNLFRHSGPERLSSSRDWRMARFEALGLSEYQDNWDGEDALAIRGDLIESTVNLFRHLEQLGAPAPDSVYPLANGGVMAEWHYDDETTVSAEIRHPGKAEVLVWHPNRESVFETVTWGKALPAHRIGNPAGSLEAWRAVVEYLERHSSKPDCGTESESRQVDEAGRAEGVKEVWGAMYQHGNAQEEPSTDSKSFTLAA